ncbi:MAG: prenyltransferase, partial [Flavobacteriaceae bacterium]
ISIDTIQLYSQEFYNLIILGIPLGLLTTNILFINQYPDYTSDKKVGKNNLVVFLGKKNSRWIYGLNLILATASLFEIANRTTDKILYYLVPIVIINSLFLFIGLMKNYDKRTLVKYNIQTIYFHMLFSIIYMIILANFN